jgi:hypothetical protein
MSPFKEDRGFIDWLGRELRTTGEVLASGEAVASGAVSVWVHIFPYMASA